MQFQALIPVYVLVVLLVMFGSYYFGRAMFFRHLGPASVSTRMFMLFFIGGGTIAIGGALAGSYGWSGLSTLFYYYLILGVVIPRIYRDKNRKRLFGYERRVRNTWYSYVLLALGSPVFYITILSVLQGNEFNPQRAAPAMIGIPVAMIIYSATLTYQLRKNQRLEIALRKDSRGHALYLRPFVLDAAVFNPSILATTNIPVVPFNGLRETFEKFFRKPVKKYIGPFVALGSPVDRTVVEGASREYFTDANWQQEAIRLIDNAAVILMQQGKSQNLTWELENLRAYADRLQKLYVVTKPAKSRFYNFLYRFENKIRDTPFATWQEFAADLNALGYKMPVQYPGDGSVIAFNTNAEALVIGQGCSRPKQYLSIIENRRKSLAQGRTQEIPAAFTPGPEQIPFAQVLSRRVAMRFLVPLFLLAICAGTYDFHEYYESSSNSKYQSLSQLTASQDNQAGQQFHIVDKARQRALKPTAAPLSNRPEGAASTTTSMNEAPAPQENSAQKVVGERSAVKATSSTLKETQPVVGKQAENAQQQPHSPQASDATFNISEEQLLHSAKKQNEQTAQKWVFQIARSSGWTGTLFEQLSEQFKSGYPMTIRAGASNEILLADYPALRCSSHLRFLQSSASSNDTVDLTFTESVQTNRQNCEDGLTVHIYYNMKNRSVIGIKYFHATLGLVGYGTLKH